MTTAVFVIMFISENNMKSIFFFVSFLSPLIACWLFNVCSFTSYYLQVHESLPESTVRTCFLWVSECW